MHLLNHLITALVLAATDRHKLALENVALKQQLIVLKRGKKRATLEDSDRVFWILLSRMIKDWAEHLVIVQPETVIRWHRRGFAYYWKRKTRAKPGRPPIPMKVIHLIRRLSKENPTWGAPHITDELALLGFDVGETTVAKYMVKQRSPEPAQRWRTFLKNHMKVSAACDFFTVPTATFKVLYVFVVLSHDRRRIEHINVTAHPTAEWTARQIIEAFPHGTEPRFLHRDRDAIFGERFRDTVKALGITEVISAKKSPWQNCYAERVIGSIRRECTDQIIALGERHLLGVLNEYVEYYNEARTHLSLEGNSPEQRQVEVDGDIAATPVLGGLHHRYSRAA